MMVDNLSSAEPGPLDAPETDTATARVMPLTILIADDSEINRRLLHKLLARLGYDALCASSGEQVLELMEQHRLDLVLMDINMDGISGVETTLRLREKEQEQDRQIYVVAVTADMPASLQVECLQAGMNDWVHKPLATRDLLEVIQTAWSHREVQQRPVHGETAKHEQDGDQPPSLTDAGREEEPEPPGVRTLDAERFAMLLDLTDREAPLLRQLYGMFHKSLKEKFMAIRDEVERGNGDAAAKAAHAIKSSSLEIGAGRLRELAERAENEAQAGNLAECRELSESGPELLARFEHRFFESLEEMDR